MNEMHITIKAKMENEAVIRTSAMAFLMHLNLSMETMMEIKTMLAEGFVNALIHGYEMDESQNIDVSFSYDEHFITLIIVDRGIGISDIDKCMQPLFTSKPALERSGMGLSIMASFADDFKLISSPNQGCKVIMKKQYE